MPVSFDSSGLAALKTRLSAATEEVRKRSESALFIEASLIMTASKKSYVPVDLGTLRNSGTVTKPEVDSATGIMSVRLFFGGAAAPYAMAIHEHPSEASPPSWKGKTIHFRGGGNRGHKYLERPLRLAANGMAARLAARIRK